MGRTNLPMRVLITDDEDGVRRMLSVTLKREGFETLEARNGEETLQFLRQGLADFMLLDLNMPGMDGIAVLRAARKLDACMPIILLSGFGTMEAAIEAGKYGAQGFLTKPPKNDELVFTIRLLLESRRCRMAGSVLADEKNTLEPMGSSGAIRHVLKEIDRIAPTEFTVIVTGETGVGKELVAQLIHRQSHRGSGPFVPVDCGSIPPTLIESELFGHEKGAFTGANRMREGSFEAARGGTLFLDEIGNLPLNMQSKLLRALQERQIYRVGGTSPIKLDVRILAATNQDLTALITKGQFRPDLFYRLNEFTIVVPPLRARQEDICCLTRRFLRETSQELGNAVTEISEAALEMLRAYCWPGNIRELRNVIRRAVLLADTHIGPEHLNIAGVDARLALAGPAARPDGNGQMSFKEIVHQSVTETERRLLRQILEKTGGNMAKAARDLGIDYKTLRTKTKLYQIS